MDPITNQQYEQFLLSSKHEITEILPRDHSTKMFQRKQQPRSLERRFYNSKHRNRCETASMQKICFLPSFFGSPEANKLILSSTNGHFLADSLSQTKETTKKYDRNTKPEKQLSPHQKMKKTEETKNLKSERIKEETWLREEIERQKREIQELKQKNQFLNEEMRKIKFEHNSQLTNVKRLNERIVKLNMVTRESNRKIQDRNQEIRKLKRIMQDQNKTINKLEETLGKKEKELVQLVNEKNQKEELEKILAEMSKDLNDIFIESKSPEHSINQSHNSIELDQEHVIHNLHERIKYQDLQINMLKRYKYQVENFEQELEKQKLQNRLLMNKLQLLPNGEKPKSRKSVESSLSFELSKDQISNN